MIQTLTNNLLSVEISSLGAELQSITNARTGHQYLYQGNTSFWGRRSPVLFPIVGSVAGGEFRMDGKSFPMSQHGFARDSEFSVVKDAPDDEAWFSLLWNDDTLKKYPRKFRLDIGYQLLGERLTVKWRVHNLDSLPMSFQIGAHPAFLYPDFSPADPVHGYFLFDGRDLHTRLMSVPGLVGPDSRPVHLDADGMLPIEASTFSINTIILEDHQTSRVSLLDKNRAPYLSLLFRAPVVGLWSPAHDAPFVCIEPWYGRCDREGFTDDFSLRDFVNTIAPGETFEASYMIIFENL